MRCPKCDQKTHSSKICSNITCNYKFVLKADSYMWDKRFIARLTSLRNKYRNGFTRSQLISHISQGSFSPSAIGCCCVSVIFLFILLISAIIIHPFIGLFIALIISVALLQQEKFQSPMAYKKAKKYVDTWCDRKVVSGLIDEAKLEDGSQEDWPETDLYDYGVKGILVVEEDYQVDYLIANGLHKDQQCLVISQNGYPSYLIPAVQNCLDQQEDLKLYFIFSPGATLGDLSARLKEKLNFEGHKLIDLKYSNEVLRNHPRLHYYADEKNIPWDILPYTYLSNGMGAILAGLAVSLYAYTCMDHGSEGAIDFG